MSDPLPSSATKGVSPSVGKAPLVRQPYPKANIVTYAQLVTKLEFYLNAEEIKKVKEAFEFADSMHDGQFRKSGEPYISHPLAVAKQCAEWRLDSQAIMAALLHDVIEDQHVSMRELATKFGMSVAEMVDGLSKLEKLQFKNHADAQGENFRKILLAMAKDVRVILIKLADRLHNMQTLDVMATPKQKRIARETMDVYVPIAHRLGMNILYRKMQDLSFYYLHPYRYDVLKRVISATRKDRQEAMENVLQKVKRQLLSQGIEATIYNREKTLYGIYRKMRRKHLAFSQILDTHGFSIVVKSPQECYTVLGILHSLYKPIPGKFQDYIAIPKLNNYQSLHTALVDPHGEPIEFQIRTNEMHQVAEVGLVAKWAYAKTGHVSVQANTNWLQSLLDIQQQAEDSAEFLEDLKGDLFADSVYVFTPQSEIVALPREATALDFAYKMNSDMGNHTVSVRINNANSPLQTVLRNGDIVDVETSPTAHPNPQWLSFVRTGKARSSIRSYLRSINTAESIELGKTLLRQALAVFSRDMSMMSPAVIQALLNEVGEESMDDIYFDIGVGKRQSTLVARMLVRHHKIEGSETQDSESPIQEAQPLIIYGSEGFDVQRATCCSPIPGDTILGELTASGLIVHNGECKIAKRLMDKEPDRWINLAWGEKLNRTFDCRLNIIVREEKGILARVASEISESNCNVLHVDMERQDEFNLFRFTVEVYDRNHLANLMRRVRHVPGVSKIAREIH